MAVTSHWSGTVTIRGITYTVGTGTFTCYAAANGTSSSEGAPQNSITLTKGNTYRLRGWAEGSTVTHPYSIGTTAEGSNIGWFKEDIFPYRTYAITFNKNTTDTVNNMPSNGTKKHGINYTLPSNIPTRTGYTFKGWGASSSSTSAVNGPTSMGFSGYYSENAAYTYYAIWEKNYARVIWNASSAASVGSSYGKNQYHWITNSSGNVIETNGYYGGTVTTPTASTYGLTRTGYSLTGWQIQTNSATGSIKGTLCNPGTAYNSNLFFKYDNNNTNVNTATKFQSYVYSVWTAKSYTITFNGNGGTLPSGLTTLSPTYNSTNYYSWSALANTTRTGYTLKGYYDKNSGGNKIYNADGTCYAGTYWNSSNKWIYDGNVTAYAQWTVNKATIHYYSNGGTAKSGYALDSSNRATEDGSLVTTSISYGSPSNVYDVATLFSPPTGYHGPSSDTDYYTSGWRIGSATATTYATQQDFNANSYITTGNATIKFYARWLINSYTLKIDPNGGYRVSDNSTSVISVTKNYNATETISERRRTGYTLTGYTIKRTSDNSTSNIGGATCSFNSSTKEGTFKQGTEAVTLTAQWKANTNTAYTVKHWTQKVGGDGLAHNSTNYKLEDTENKTGTTASSVTPAVKSYNGFKSPSTQTVTIKADGTTVVNYYYDRIVYTITYTLNGGTASSTLKTDYSILSDTFTLPSVSKTGYTFSGWTGTGLSSASTSVSVSKGSTGNRSYTANWTANTVRIAYYRNGGTIGSTDYEDNGSGYIKRKSDNNVYFHTLNYASTDTDPYNASTFGLTKTGYSFNQWKVRSSGQILNQDAQQTITNYVHYNDEDKTAANTSLVTCYLDAQWSANTNTAYKVKHWKQNVNAANTQNSTNYTLAETENLTGTTGASVTPARKTYTGFTSPSGTTITIAADGSSEVNYYYTRTHYTLTVYPIGGTFNGSTSTFEQELDYGATQSLPIPTRSGYDFGGWFWTSYGSINNSKFSNSVLSGAEHGINVYNNCQNDTPPTYAVSHTYKADQSDKPQYNNDYIQITKSSTAARPALGGFYKTVASEYNKTYYHTFYAKLPTGYHFWYYNNTLPNNSSFTWLSDNRGTGSWKMYCYKLVTGSSGTKSTFGFIAARLNSDLDNTKSSLTWYLGGNQITESPTSEQTFTMSNNNSWVYPAWIPRTYTVSFDLNYGNIKSNLFRPHPGPFEDSTRHLRYTYDNTTETITLNGYLTGNQILFNYPFTATTGDYTFSYEVISGSMSGGCAVVEAADSSLNNLSSRKRLDMNNTSSRTQVLNFDSSSVSNTKNIKFWIWLDSSNSNTQVTFNNYKIKIKIEKNSSVSAYSPASIPVEKDTTYKIAGSLPTPYRAGFSFAGWYTSASGGTKIENSTSFTGTSNTTLYAHWTERNLVKIYNGSSWVNAVPFVYDGTNWRETYPYVYNSGWKQCK